MTAYGGGGAAAGTPGQSIQNQSFNCWNGDVLTIDVGSGGQPGAGGGGGTYVYGPYEVTCPSGSTGNAGGDGSVTVSWR